MNKLTIVVLLVISVVFTAYSQIITLDNTFGQNGKTIIPNTTEIYFFDFDIQGNIIAAGIAVNDGGKYNLTIAKTNADGIIDESFGNGGLAKISGYDHSSPLGLSITDDNKIVVIGQFSKVQFQGYETLIVRLDENGMLDEHFGDSGRVNFAAAEDVVLLNCESNDFMLLGGVESERNEIGQNVYVTITGYYISKYNYHGNLDENFGDRGKAHLPNCLEPRAAKILRDGSIAVAGAYNSLSDHELGLCKLTPAGQLDTVFANDGIWHWNTTPVFDLSYEGFYGILEDSSGDLILTGTGRHTNESGWRDTGFLSKFSAGGIPDSDFGENGFYWFDFLGISSKFFKVGENYVCVTTTAHGAFRMYYVNADGSFGNYLYTSSLNYLHDAKIQGSPNKILLAGACRTSDANFALERVTVDFDVSIPAIDFNSDEVKIFPNPAQDNLYFDQNTSYEIIDIQGKTLLKSETPVNFVPVVDLEVGIYFVRFGNSVHKFVKE
ncbi:MAG: T9SS type A sorting domain-containing protein [Bacteroidales bacterium]|nr:T9SS type A sorting domain-containing protein [Bacteroidales bacterium]MDD4362422.1 T9SS type A sorting domain-containing protein [Bacteroidales bacterium]